MFSVQGQIVNTFSSPPSEKFPNPSYKVQLLGEQFTRDGQIRKEMVDLVIPRSLQFPPGSGRPAYPYPRWPLRLR